MLAQSTRPKCKADTYYVPMSDGVYLRGNNSRLVLKGKSLYPLLEHLVPNLNGDATLEEITGGLDAEKKRMVMNLIEKLFAHQFLQDTSQDQLHTLRPLELETHASDIAFIESFQTSAAHRFECFQNKHFLVIGSGSGFTSLVQASLQSGVRRTDAIATPEDGSFSPDGSFPIDGSLAIDGSKLHLCIGGGKEASSPGLVLQGQRGKASPGSSPNAEADLASVSSPTARLLAAPAWDNEAEVRAMLQGYDAIIHIADRSTIARAQLLNRLCIEEQKTLMQAIVIDDHAWLGPLVCPETGSCWECAWRRLQANMTTSAEQLARYEFRDQPLAAGSCSLATPEAMMIANRLIFGLFHYFTQTSAPEAAAKLSMLDLETYLSESHAFLPHPHCLACQHTAAPTASQFLEQMQRFQHQGPADPDSFLANVASYVDEKLGLFTALETGNFVQAPLAVYRAHLSNPPLQEFQDEPFSVIGAGTDVRDAVTRAAQKACERYAASLVDQRRLLSSEVAQQASCPVIMPDQLIEPGDKMMANSLSPRGMSDMWTWALDLRTQQAALVPASHAFSSLREQSRGIASGQTWEEALCQALLDWCNELTMEEVQSAQQAYPQVDLAGTSLTPEGLYLSQLLKATDSRVTVYDVTGSLQVPTFAICLDGKVVAYSTHCDQAQALRMGLEQALRQYQSEQSQQAEYAVDPVPDLPANLRGEQLSLPSYTLPGAWPARLAWLLGQLQMSGLHAYVVPLNHDPALARALPFIARVLLLQYPQRMIPYEKRGTSPRGSGGPAHLSVADGSRFLNCAPGKRELKEGE